MDLYQIRYFLAISETGNFTKAADRLYVSQPSLSAGIKKLEQELGTKLFERGGRKVLLTPEGHFFLEKAQNILREYQAALHTLKGFHNRPILKVGTLHTVRGYNLARLFGDFHQEHQNVSLKLYNGHLEELRDWLETGKIDFAITSLNQSDIGKTSEVLFQQQFCLAVPVTHAFAKLNSISLVELDKQPYIERIHCEIWRTNPHLFKEAGIQPQTVYWANNEEWVISLVQVGLGVSIMPMWRELDHLVYVPITDVKLDRVIGIQWRAQQESDVVDKFRVFAKSHDWQV